MIPLSFAEIAAITGGRQHDITDPEARITGPVVIDSREAGPGTLFAAFDGEHVDGHDFAEGAVASGAVAVLATRPVGVPAIVVDDVTTALGALARHSVHALGTQVIALTGSSGKTSTKDLIAQLLERLGPTVWTPGSLNNEIGLPLTALRADESTRHLVLEMGARGIGHIRYLTELTPPRIGVVLNVGTAHIGEFGGREQIAQAKGEMVETLPAARDGGVAVLNADDPNVRAMAARTSAAVLLFGEDPEADVRAENVRLTEHGTPAFSLHTPTGCGDVTMRLYGEHHVSNALAAAAVAHQLGMPAGDIAEALSSSARCRVGGWRSPSAPTVSRSSMTPTTPIPTPCGPRCVRSPPWGRQRRPGGPDLGGAGQDGRAGRRYVRRARRDRAARRPAQRQQARGGRWPGGRLARHGRQERGFVG